MWPDGLPDRLQIGLQLGLVEAVGSAFDGEPVLAEEGVGLVAVFLPESEGHGLRLAPGDASKAVSVILGHIDAMAAPTAFPGLGAATLDHIPHVLGLGRQRQRESDVDAA